MDGSGREDYEDGRVYIGDFKEGKKWGYGKMMYSKELKQYEGPWVDNLKNGNGVETNFRTNTKRTGEWKDGKWVRWISAVLKVEVMPDAREISADVTNLNV